MQNIHVAYIQTILVRGLRGRGRIPILGKVKSSLMLFLIKESPNLLYIFNRVENIVPSKPKFQNFENMYVHFIPVRNANFNRFSKSFRNRPETFRICLRDHFKVYTSRTFDSGLQTEIIGFLKILDFLMIFWGLKF